MINTLIGFLGNQVLRLGQGTRSEVFPWNGASLQLGHDAIGDDLISVGGVHRLQVFDKGMTSFIELCRGESDRMVDAPTPSQSAVKGTIATYVSRLCSYIVAVCNGSYKRIYLVSRAIRLGMSRWLVAATNLGRFDRDGPVSKASHRGSLALLTIAPIVNKWWLVSPPVAKQARVLLRAAKKVGCAPLDLFWKESLN